jgi:hypothetical protein
MAGAGASSHFGNVSDPNGTQPASAPAAERRPAAYALSWGAASNPIQHRENPKLTPWGTIQCFRPCARRMPTGLSAMTCRSRLRLEWLLQTHCRCRVCQNGRLISDIGYSALMDGNETINSNAASSAFESAVVTGGYQPQSRMLSVGVQVQPARVGSTGMQSFAGDQTSH